jgi:hypothetical protein
VLPLTGRQLGRSWWLATVALPSLVLTALLFSGSATYCHFRPGHSFPTVRLVLGSLFTFVWLGLQFTLSFVATRGSSGNRLELIGTGLMGLVTTLVYLGNMLLCLNASSSPLKTAVLLAFGLPLTLVGWVFAEQFEPGRAALYLGRIDAPNLRGSRVRPAGGEPAPPRGVFRVPGGCGGMGFLLSTLSVRGFLHISLIVALMALVFQVPGVGLSPSASPDLFAPMVSFMPAWFIVFYLFMPALQHLRFLRTLPISANRLATVLLALVIVPLVALGALLWLIVWPLWGTTVALGFLNCFAFALGGSVLCAFFAIWRGSGVQSYALILLSLLGFLLGHLWLQGHFQNLKRPLAIAGPFAVACVLLAFVLTRLVLVYSSHVYRIRLNSFGEIPVGKNS